MKTPNLDSVINDLKAYDRNNMLSDNGRNQLNEYEAIKRALSFHDVVGQSEQFYCLNRSIFGDGRKCDKQCLSCEKNIPKR
jgi:hypothetical protein